MNGQEHISDETLNAFVDGQLDGGEARLLLEAMAKQPELRARVEDVRQIQDRIRYAYAGAKPPRAAPRLPVGRVIGVGQALAASLVLAALTFGAGWLGHSRMASDQGVENLAQTAATPRFGEVGGSYQGQQNVILHLSSGDDEKLQAALDEAEHLLRSYKNSERPFRLEIVANGGGLNLLRRDVSPLPQRVNQLLGDYQNVSFLACSKALDRLREKGVKIDLLEEAGVTSSALEQILLRMREGWVYIKV